MFLSALCFCMGLAQCLLLWLLGRTGQTLTHKAHREQEAHRYVAPGDWPRVAMIIPVAGTDPRIAPALQSLLEQDYPRISVFLVTGTAQEPAAATIAHLRQDHPDARHVIAGPAQGCGQKNHNSLMGVAAAGDSADVYLFCDSTHMARPDFVRCLVMPIASGEAAFATGYHVVRPEDTRIATLGYCLCVMLMRFLQGISAFTQPWGGAMAMRREAFRRHGVAELWRHNVVDDCSLGALLCRQGVHVRLCAGALLETVANACSWTYWRAWMERQVLFLRFCMPGQWILLGVLALLMTVPVVWGLSSLLLGLVGRAGASAPFLALVWLVMLGACLSPWRAFLRLRISPGRWMAAFCAAVGMFALVYLKNLATRHIVWHRKKYTVGRDGRVLSMRDC